MPLRKPMSAIGTEMSSASIRVVNRVVVFGFHRRSVDRNPPYSSTHKLHGIGPSSFKSDLILFLQPVQFPHNMKRRLQETILLSGEKLL